MALANCQRNYTADAVIPKRRIVKAGSADGYITLATAAADFLMGVSDLGCTAIGDRVDIIIDDTALVEYGGTVTRGAPLTADSTGRAIVAAPSAGANVRIIGFAEISGVVGDIGEVNINRGFMQG